MVGNPIVPSLGLKIEHIVDASSGGLSLERTFRSGISTFGANVRTPYGYGWYGLLSVRITKSTQPNSDPIAYATLADGSTVPFLSSSAGVWTADADLSAYTLNEIRDQSNVQIGWNLRLPDGAEYVYDIDGRLITTKVSGVNELVILRDSSGRANSIQDKNGRSSTIHYDVPGRIDKITLPDGSLVEYAYDADNRISLVTRAGATVTYGYQTIAGVEGAYLTSIKDESNTTYAEFGYDASGLATSTKHAGNVNLHSVSYTNGGNDVLVTFPSGYSDSYHYSTFFGSRKLSAFTRSCTGCTMLSGSNTYDLNGRIDNSIDFASAARDYNFGPTGLLIQRIEASNDATGKKRTTQTDWHATFRVPTERRVYNAANTLVAKSAYTYNARGQALTASQIDPATSVARTTTMTYCENADFTAGTCPLVGLVTSVNGPRTDVADTVGYTYYPSDDASCAASPTTCPHRKGDLWKVTNALGQITETLTYDGTGRVLSVKDANGVITDMEYHPRGWLTARKVRGANAAVETDDAITRIEYWPTGLVKKVIQPDGAFTAYAYDAAHRLTDISDNAGNTIHYTLDNAGNRTQEDTKDPGNVLKRTLSRVHNQLGQLQTQADAQANPTDFTYDANGNTDTVTDALDRVTDNNYDPLNRLSRTLQDVGGINAETQFQYDVQDNLTQVTDPKGLNTTYTYNGLGDLTQLVSPDTGTTIYTYDSAGNRATQTDARNQTSTYSYDALNRLTGIVYATSSLNVGYTYDTTQTACQSGETFSTGRLTQLTDASGSTQYCYDRFGNLVRKVQTTNGVALTVRYTYTLAGQLGSVTYPDGAVATYTRDAQGRTTQVNVQRAGAASEVLLNQASYHPFGPVAGWTYGNGRQLLRPLNQNYQPTAIQDVGVGGLSVGFQYDPVGNLTQLTPAASTTPLVKFDYDALSRLTAFKDGPTDVAIESYAYDATGNRQSFTNAAGTQAYTYPSTSHRLTQAGATARTYDAAGNTTAIGGTAKEFVYDETGRMSQVKQNAIVQKTYLYNGKGEQVRKYAGTANTYTLYDEAGHWLGDYDNTGAALQQAIWLDDLPVGLIANGNQLHYVEPDHLGTPRVVIEVARNVSVWTWDLKSEAFGNSVPAQDPDGDSTALMFDMRFPGQRYDASTGLNYNYFRDYDAGSGRYAESDPIGLDSDISTYSYVGGSPFNYVDMAGLQRVRVTPRLTSPWTDAPSVDPENEQAGQRMNSDPWDMSTAGDGSTARDWGRPNGRGGRKSSWCVIKCDGQQNGVSGRGNDGIGCCPAWVYGLGVGTSDSEAWNNAWDAANFNTPQGCMKKHCRGIAGSCKNRKGGKAKGGM